MKAIIHYNGRYEDDITIEGENIEELRTKALKECQEKRGWEENNCWSEVIKE